MNRQGPISQSNDIAAALDEIEDIAVPACFLRSNAKEAMVSSSGQGEKSDVATRDFSHPGSGCADIIHEMANSMTAVLINAQVLEWKLPPYSRVKRAVREIERHAQRSAALLQRLLRLFEINLPEDTRQESCGQVACLHGTMAAVTTPGLGTTDAGPVKLPPPMLPPSAPDPRASPETVLTSICDRCTSILFPKEER